MKPILLFLLTASICGKAQQDSLPEYEDKGPIKTIECSCDEGKFKKNKLVKSIIPDYPECPYSNRTEYFDSSGNIVRVNTSFFYDHEKFTRTEYIFYLENGETIEKTYELNSKKDTTVYSITYTYEFPQFHSIDSTYNDGELGYIFTIAEDSITNTRIMEFQSMSWDWGNKTTYHYNEQNQIYLITNEPSGNNKNEETTHVTHVGNTTTYKSVHEGDTVRISTTVLNERGLPQSFVYRTTSDDLPINYNYTYEYLYDDHGNWIEQRYFSDGKLIAIERRKIIYAD